MGWSQRCPRFKRRITSLERCWIETESNVNTPQEAKDFGVNVPAHPEYDIARAKEMSEKSPKRRN